MPRLVIGLVLLAAAIAAVAYGVLLTTIEDADYADPGVAQFIGGCFIAVGFIVAGVAALVLRSAGAKRRRNAS
jgi:hypothetical protein